MKQVWKRRAVVAAVLVLVGTSVYLNWRYAGDVADTSKVLGQSTLVHGETAEAQADTADSGGDDYFSTARLSRKQARDTAISMLEEAKQDENAAEDVLASIAGNAVQETEGVSALMSANVSDLMGGKKMTAKGVKVELDGENIVVNLFIVVRYGNAISEVAKKAQKAVHAALEGMTGFKVAAVNVHVGGISFN